MVLRDCWKVCATPWNDPWIEVGMPIWRIARSTDGVASPSDFPGARLKEIVLATNDAWWFTESGVLPAPMLVKAASGIIISLLVLTAAADEATPLPTFASALVAALRAELAAIVAAVAAARGCRGSDRTNDGVAGLGARGGSARGADVDILQGLRTLPILGRNLHDDVVWFCAL